SWFPRRIMKSLEPPSSRSAIVSIGWGRTPSKPLWPSGKKGVPRIKRDLPPLWCGGALRELPLQAIGQSLWWHGPHTRLLSLPHLPAGTLSLGWDVADCAATADARRRRSGVSGRHSRKLRQSGGTHVAEASGSVVERIDRGAYDGSGRHASGPALAAR